MVPCITFFGKGLTITSHDIKLKSRRELIFLENNFNKKINYFLKIGILK